jgi:hypothetical protein
MNSFTIEIPAQDSKKMEDFNQLMKQVQDETVEYIKGVASELDVSDECAMDVVYLRGRSRHTEELEKELIRLHSIGQPPNMCDFPQNI